MRHLLLLFLVISCASSSRTKYGPYKKKQGFRDLASESRLKVVTFQANASTEKNDAELFAKFKAIEICHEAGFKLAHMVDVKDSSVSKDVIRSSGNGFPSYYYGMSPYYSRYHSGFGVGFSTMSSSSYEETYVYPDFTVTFDCVNVAYGPELFVREVPAEDMKLLVKDLKGALQVEKIMAESPNVKVLEEGDVILRVKERIQTAPEFLGAFHKDERAVEVGIMREGVRKNVILKSRDVSEFSRKSQDEIIIAACNKKEIKEERSICSPAK